MWLADHYKDILAVIGGLVTAATVVVHLTPSQRDDAILAKVIKVLDFLSTVSAKPTIPADAPKA